MPTTLDLVDPGDYTLYWGEVTVDDIVYRPSPNEAPLSLEARLEPYTLQTTYTAAP